MVYLKQYLWTAFIIVFTSQANNVLAQTHLPEDRNKAVILAYHKIGEDLSPQQSLPLNQFKAHVKEIINGNYNVLQLSQIIKSVQNKQPLPYNTIAITLEGAHRSAITKAAPLLQNADIPFTIFYASNTLDQKKPSFASWKDLKRLAKDDNIDIQTLPAKYAHISHQKQQDILINLNKARQRHREEFQTEAKLLSYPYGEYSLELKTLAKKQGYEASLGLHSGAVYSGSDLFALPRFSMTGQYGDIERFRLVTKSLPLPVKDLEPSDPLLKSKTFYTGFTLPKTLHLDANKLACFISNQGKAEIEKLGTRIEIRSKNLQPDETRIRLNCTIPGPQSAEDETQWRWLGILYHRKKPEISELQAAEPLELQE